MAGSKRVFQRCSTCGAETARTYIDNVLLCDRGADGRIANATGWPELPEPPQPEEFAGPDRRKHRMCYRLWRSPGGIVAEAEELRRDGDINPEGYHFKVMAPHDGDVEQLMLRLRAEVQRGIGQLHLQRDAHGGLLLADDEARGRFIWSDASDYPYDVVVDGRRLTWEEFGRALEPYEGWRFRLTLSSTDSE